MSSLRIVDYNYASQSNVSITASSEDVNFPASNVGHEFRSKVWRSTGSYVITSSNNHINFKETSLGAELTATLVTGIYSADDLAQAIKDQMEAASINSRTYTVSRSSTNGKWTISGSTFLSILFSTGTNTSTSLRSVIGFGSNDFTGTISYTGPISAWHTEEGVVIDLFSAEEIDTVSILFDPRIGIKLSDSATITIQASATNSWTSPGFSQQVYIDNNYDVINLFLDQAEEYRYWRVKVVDPQNAYGYIELGSIVLGKDIQLGKCADNGFKFVLDEGSKLSTNDYGNNYVDEYPIIKELSFNFGLLTYTQQQALENVFRRCGTRIPVFVALDPFEAVFDKDQFTMYGRMQDKFGSDHIKRNYFKSELKIRESL